MACPGECHGVGEWSRTWRGRTRTSEAGSSEWESGQGTTHGNVYLYAVLCHCCTNKSISYRASHCHYVNAICSYADDDISLIKDVRRGLKSPKMYGTGQKTRTKVHCKIIVHRNPLSCTFIITSC